MPQRRSSVAPGVCRLGAGGTRWGNTICRCFTTDGQCSHFWSVGFLLTRTNGLFLSVAQLRRLGMCLNFLAGTNLFLHKHKMNLVVPINCDRIWSSPSKYDFIVRISFLPIYSLVISQILIDVSVCCRLSRTLVTLKEPFCLILNVIP